MIELLADGEGLAIIGDPAVVDRFLVSVGLPARDLELPRLGSVLSGGSATLHAGSTTAAGSGRWVQLTKESAKAL